MVSQPAFSGYNSGNDRPGRKIRVSCVRALARVNTSLSAFVGLLNAALLSSPTGVLQPPTWNPKFPHRNFGPWMTASVIVSVGGCKQGASYSTVLLTQSKHFKAKLTVFASSSWKSDGYFSHEACSILPGTAKHPHLMCISVAILLAWKFSRHLS